MTPPAFDHHKIAPAAPPRSRAIGVRAETSPGPDATPIINDQMAVRSRGWGVPRRQRCVLPFGRIFVGIGERSTALHAIKHSRLTSHFQCVSEANPGHFRVSRLNAPNLDRGVHDEIHETHTFGTADDR